MSDDTNEGYTGPTAEVVDLDPLRDTPSWVAELNKEYAVISAGSSVGVLVVESLKLERPSILSERSFDLRIRNEPPVLVAKADKDTAKDADKSKDRYEPRARAWLKHKRRRQYLGGIGSFPLGKEPRGWLNLWGGFAVQPARGDWSLFEHHLHKVFCCGVEAHYNYVLNFFAFTVQRPFEKPGVVLAAQGPQGTGKGSAFRPLMKIFGRHGLQITDKEALVGSFNGNLVGKLFLFVDEAFFAGDPSIKGRLKGMITEETLHVNEKYGPSYMTNFPATMCMASNEAHAFNVEMTDRRFAVFEPSDMYRGKTDYFKALREEMDAGAVAAFLHDMLARDISDFNAERDIPTTRARAEQKEHSLGPIEAYWLECLAEGRILPGKDGVEVAEPDHDLKWEAEPIEVSRRALTAAINDHGKPRRPLTPQTVRTPLNRLVTVRDADNRALGLPISRSPQKGTLGGKQVNVWHFPPLDECRRAFEQATGITIGDDE
jgi:hypothetical protein